MLSKIPNRLFSSSTKDKRLNANENYNELCVVLGEILLPIGFVREKEDAGIGKFVKYQRGSLLVELYFDIRDWLFLFFASKDVHNPVSPPRQVSMTFFPNDSTDELKIALRAKLEE